MKPMRLIVALIVSLFGMVSAQPTSYKKLRQEYAAAVQAYKKSRRSDNQLIPQNATPKDKKRSA